MEALLFMEALLLFMEARVCHLWMHCRCCLWMRVCAIDGCNAAGGAAAVFGCNYAVYGRNAAVYGRNAAVYGCNTAIYGCVLCPVYGGAAAIMYGSISAGTAADI
eukprot:3732787-Rhodomonas_salina.1